jgi:hypothetical protein
MNHVRDALLTALRIITGLLPAQWRGVAMLVLTGLATVDWGESDERWADAAKLVADLLRDMEQAGALVGIDLVLAARAAAEVRYTRALKSLGILGTV